ncbi:MAG: hypothetical protein ACE14M_03810 [Terriglobales bacterium]
MDTERILAELRAERSRIDQAIIALEALSRTGRAQSFRKISPATPGQGRRGRRRMSAAARKRISEMMKRRWAERKKKAKLA